jgi:hypothetical protein
MAVTRRVDHSPRSLPVTYWNAELVWRSPCSDTIGVLTGDLRFDKDAPCQRRGQRDMPLGAGGSNPAPATKKSHGIPTCAGVFSQLESFSAVKGRAKGAHNKRTALVAADRCTDRFRCDGIVAAVSLAQIVSSTVHRSIRDTMP